PWVRRRVLIAAAGTVVLVAAGLGLYLWRIRASPGRMEDEAAGPATRVSLHPRKTTSKRWTARSILPPMKRRAAISGWCTAEATTVSGIGSPANPAAL